MSATLTAAQLGPERAYPNLTCFHEVDKGGHFAAWEQPELFSEELWVAFRSLRWPEQGTGVGHNLPQEAPTLHRGHRRGRQLLKE